MGLKIVPNNYRETNFKKIKHLGEGASCSVDEVKEVATGNHYAMKLLLKNQQASKMLFEREIRIMKELGDHPNCLQYVDAFEESRHYVVVTGLLSGGELFDRVEKGKFTEKIAAGLTRQMLLALKYCHDKQIMHRDLKPENFVFVDRTETSVMKLIDFGCAVKAQDDEVVKDMAGSAYYVAPEVLANVRRTGKTWKAADMWSVGVIIFLFVCGYPPFDGRKQEEIFEKVERGRYKVKASLKAQLSPSVLELIDKLLVKDIGARMTVDQALDHPWVKGITATDTVLADEILDNLHNFRGQCRLKKAVGKVMANKMTDADKAELATLFQKFDKNGDGRLDPEEIAEMMKAIGKNPAEAAEMMEGLDEDGDGTIDMNELATAQGMTKVGKDDEMKRAFEMFDKDGDGFVTGDEINELCGFLTPDKARELMNEADASGDGKIDLNEWIKAMQAGSAMMKQK